MTNKTTDGDTDPHPDDQVPRTVPWPVGQPLFEPGVSDLRSAHPTFPIELK